MMTTIQEAFAQSRWVNSRECVDCGCDDQSHTRYRRRCEPCESAEDARLAANTPNPPPAKDNR